MGVRSTTRLFACLLMLWLFSACDSFRTAGHFASGRRAFLANNHEEALGHFQKVSKNKPGYVFTASNYREGVWTYVGRCQYYLGRFADARQSLEHAIIADSDDYLARIFLGLTLARQGDGINGATEMQRGLAGLNAWIDYENSRDPSKSFWDPNREIRKEITSSLAMVSRNNPDRQKLIETVEWIGLKMEYEIEQVRRDERRAR